MANAKAKKMRNRARARIAREKLYNENPKVLVVQLKYSWTVTIEKVGAGYHCSLLMPGCWLRKLKKIERFSFGRTLKQSIFSPSTWGIASALGKRDLEIVWAKARRFFN